MRWKFLVPFFVFVILAGFLFKGLFLDPRKVPSALIDKPAPEFALPNLMEPGKTVTKQSLLGKVYLLNVWASWCPTCAEEHPYFMKLRSQGETVTMIGFNYRDEAAMARAWLSTHGNPYAAVAVDADGRVGMDFGVYGAPETFLIDKKGVIRHKVIGVVNESVWRSELVTRIRQLEAER